MQNILLSDFKYKRMNETKTETGKTQYKSCTDYYYDFDFLSGRGFYVLRII